MPKCGWGKSPKYSTASLHGSRQGVVWFYEVRMYRIANAPKTDNATKPSDTSTAEHAELPARVPLGKMLRDSERSLSTQSVTKALGLGDTPTNQEVINALYRRYDRSYPQMYKGAERDFGINVAELVRAKDEPFVLKGSKQERQPSGSEPGHKESRHETALSEFLRTQGLDGSSTNRELINKLYERYGANDATTYARARRELGIDIDALTRNRNGRIDGLASQVAADRGKAEPPTHNAEAPATSANARSKRERVANGESTQPRHDARDERPSEVVDRAEPLKMTPQPERVDNGPSRQSGIELGKLIRNYPRSPLDANHADADYTGPFLRDQFKLDNWIDNSCAIRLTYALHKSGVDIATRGALTETIRPVSADGTPEAPFTAALRANELFAKIDKHLGGAEKVGFEFGPDARPDLNGLNGIVLYEYRSLETGRLTRHIGILNNGVESTEFDPITEGARGKATVLRIDSDYGRLASR